MIVYAVTHLTTGRRYIGLTGTSLSRRWDSHRKAMRDGVKTALYDAMRRYGVEAFEIAPVASLLPGLGRPELCELERLIIAQEGTMVPRGYNLTTGGDGGPIWAPSPAQVAATLHTPEVRRKAALSRRGQRSSDEARANISASWTPERRAAASARQAVRNRERVWTDESRMKLSTIFTGQPRGAPNKERAA